MKDLRRVLIGRLLSYLLCAAVALITVTPFIWMVLGSLKDATEVVLYPPTFMPHQIAWGNYVDVFTTVPFLRYILNSFLVASTVTLIALLFHSMAAYSLAQGGHHAEATAMLRKFERNGASEPLNVSLAYLGLGDKDNALIWLDRAVDKHEDSLTDYVTPLTSPIFTDVRGDPRFHKVIEKMGLAPYAFARETPAPL